MYQMLFMKNYLNHYLIEKNELEYKKNLKIILLRSFEKNLKTDLIYILNLENLKNL